MNSEQIQLRVKAHVEAFEVALKKCHDGPTAIAVMQEIGKDYRMKQISLEQKMLNGNGYSGSFSPSGTGEKLATEKQLNYLKTLGVDHEDGLTAKEASSLIDAAKVAAEVVFRLT